MAIREFLLLYAPLYGGNVNKFTLEADDLAALQKYTAEARRDATQNKLTSETAGAARLASLRTDVPFASIIKSIRSGEFSRHHASWLYLVKTRGADYGLGFFAGHIVLEQTAQGLQPRIDNPFIHRQILALKNNPRLSALMAAEGILHKTELDTLAPDSPAAFSAHTRKLQQALTDIGFDPGPADGFHGTMTDIALREFQILYGEGKPASRLNDAEERLLFNASEAARKDAAAFGVPAFAAGAIRMASEKNGMDFGYMMELAAAESSFIHDIKAKTSSATGLYQFIEATWHFSLRAHGEKYGLAGLSTQVEIYTDAQGRTQARMPNPFVRATTLELRKQAPLSSLLSAEFQLENRGKQSCYVSKTYMTRAGLYLAHFLGAHDAVYFLNEMEKNPSRGAATTFPEAAAYNRGVFYVLQNGQVIRERSLREVHDLFARKFDRGVYEAHDRRANPPAAGV
jgi:hypothetical protein